jgi:hypothetical protein
MEARPFLSPGEEIREVRYNDLNNQPLMEDNPN